jgi:replication-associated recombination protein RarA
MRSIADDQQKAFKEAVARGSKLVKVAAAKEASLTVLRGMPGMGKKTSASHFIERARDRFVRYCNV